MSAPPADRLVRDARIGDDDTPHEAATHLWAQVVASHDVDPDRLLAPLGVLERVVLVMVDVMGVSPATVAAVLNTEPDVARASLDHARERLGLPSTRATTCEGWEQVRDRHAPGDPRVLSALREHAAACAACSSTVADDQDRSHRWLLRGAGRAAVPGAAVATGSALASTAVVAAALVAAGVAAGALAGPVPEPPVPEPVVVDADPGLPSDEEPAEGWPAPVTDAGPEDDDGDAGTATTDDGGTAPADDDLRDTVDDTVDDLGETVDDLGDAVEDTVDDVTDTVDQTTGTVDDTVEDTTDTLEDTVSEGTDALP